MALQNTLNSPLLSPRPQILGVGRRSGVNTFVEFIKLSPLTVICIKSMLGLKLDTKGITNIQEQYLCQWLTFTRYVKSPISIKLNQGLKSNDLQTDKTDTSHKLGKKKTKRNIKEDYDKHTVDTNSKGYADKVIDRDELGKEKLVLYSFNKKTVRIFEIFDTLNIPFETEIYKIKEHRKCVSSDIFYCKNLFLKDRKGQYYLVICHEDTNMDLKQLRKTLKAYRNFNFVSGEEMKDLICTDPGGVTPLALIFANSLDVSMVISKTLYKEGASLMFHPLDSNLATKISLMSLLRFLKYVGHSVTIVD